MSNDNTCSHPHCFATQGAKCGRDQCPGRVPPVPKCSVDSCRHPAGAVCIYAECPGKLAARNPDATPAAVGPANLCGRAGCASPQGTKCAAHLCPGLASVAGAPSPVPSHYGKRAIQPVEYILANDLPFLEGCVVKRITRWRDKDGIKDLEKIKHEVDLLIAEARKR